MRVFGDRFDIAYCVVFIVYAIAEFSASRYTYICAWSLYTLIVFHFGYWQGSHIGYGAD